jgi:hypothetical protein
LNNRNTFHSRGNHTVIRNSPDTQGTITIIFTKPLI